MIFRIAVSGSECIRQLYSSGEACPFSDVAFDIDICLPRAVIRLPDGPDFCNSRTSSEALLRCIPLCCPHMAVSAEFIFL